MLGEHPVPKLALLALGVLTLVMKLLVEAANQLHDIRGHALEGREGLQRLLEFGCEVRRGRASHGVEQDVA
jgi:hypothetical protein